MENPLPKDNPTLTRPSTLVYWKKAILYFMVDTNEHWNKTHKSGNPTRAWIANQLVAVICWKEIHRVGKAA